MLRCITEDGESGEDEDNGTEKASRVERNVAPRRDFCSGVIFNDGTCARALRPNFRSLGNPRTSTIKLKMTRSHHRTKFGQGR